MVKTPVGYVLFFFSCWWWWGGGGSGKQAHSRRRGESAKKRPFMATKWAQNGVILAGLDLDSVGYTPSSVGRMCSVNIIKTSIGYA